MPLSFVEIQQRAHLPVQPRVYMRQTLCQILVYRRLADAEILCGGAHGAPLFDDVYGQIAGPFL